MRKIFRLIMLIMLVTVSSGVRAGDSIERNIVYGMYYGLALLMDVYTPAEGNGRAVIMVPGSGWEAWLGYGARQLKDSPETSAVLGLEALVSAGYTVFVINHRGTPGFRYPAPIEDAQRAVRFIRHHAGDYAVDPKLIGAVGGSSGGHLVNLLATLDGEGMTKDPDPVNRHSARVQAVVAIYAVADTVDFATSNPWAAGAMTALLGPVNPAWKPPSLKDPVALDMYQRASPLYHLDAGDAPVLLVHGDADSIVPFSQSERFHAALQEQGIATRLIRIVGGEHGPGLLRDDSPSIENDIVQWLDNHLSD